MGCGTASALQAHTHARPPAQEGQGHTQLVLPRQGVQRDPSGGLSRKQDLLLPEGRVTQRLPGKAQTYPWVSSSQRVSW